MERPYLKKYCEYIDVNLRSRLNLLCFRLVYLWAQRRNNRVHSSKCCHHPSGRPEHFINNAISSHQFLTHSHQPKHIWTVENDPIYEDITEVKRKSALSASARDSSSSVTGSLKPSASCGSVSSVQYGVITAKEVARYVPCTEATFRR